MVCWLSQYLSGHAVKRTPAQVIPPIAPVLQNRLAVMSGRLFKVHARVVILIFQVILRFPDRKPRSEAGLSVEVCLREVHYRMHRKILLFAGLIMAHRTINFLL